MLRALSGKPGWFAVDLDTAAKLSGVPGLKFDQHKGLWQLHRSHLPLLESPEAFQLIASHLQPKNAFVDPWEHRDAWTADRGFKLRTTQHQAIDFFAQRRGILLGDDMRLGKTLSAIMCHARGDAGQLVIIAPLSTRAVWLGWLRRVFPEHVDNIGIMTGRKYDAEKASKPIVWGHYDVLQGWASTRRIGTLVLDEAHLLTNKDAKRTVAAATLATYSDRVIAMTGTPIWDLPPDLWSIINMVAPGAWGNWYDFSDRYGAPVQTGYGKRYTGISNTSELRCRLQEVMLRRRWVDCSDDLPPISRSVVVADLNDRDRRQLDILAGAIKSERSNTAGNLAAYRKRVANIKLGAAYVEAAKVMHRDEPVVLWTWHRDLADSIGDGLGPAYKRWVIHGDIAPDEREKRIAEWKACPNGALIATMAVAQVGIDLSHARIAIFVEIDFTPAVIGQAEMRTFAPTRGMDVIFVVANHLVDQRIVRALVAKLGAANPLGVGAAVDAIDALRDAVLGPSEIGDLDRLLEDMLASAA